MAQHHEEGHQSHTRKQAPLPGEYSVLDNWHFADLY
jgi:hypothetical protein